VLSDVDGGGTPTLLEPLAGGVGADSFSPDGRWVVYGTNEGGRPELWMRAYTDVTAGRWRIGPVDNDVVFWTADGREVFYRSDDRWVSRAVRAGAPGSAPDLGPVVTLDVPPTVLLRGVTPDGHRFLGVRPVGANQTAISFVLNFFEELRAKVPVQ
jgi:Tol biopolymer transport system component